MKRVLWPAMALILASALPAIAAPGSCEKIKADIGQRIVKNGVAASDFSLTIVPNDQSDQADAQVVGHCANDTHKILYRRVQSNDADTSNPPVGNN